MSATKTKLREVRSVRWRDTGKWLVIDRGQPVTGLYDRRSMADRTVLDWAVNVCGRTNEPVLTVTGAGAFVITPGLYPQEASE